MVARNRLPPWHEELTLSNGRKILIRPIHPADGEPLRASFVLLEPDEIRNRYLRAVQGLSSAEIERLTHPDPRSEFALVAAEPYPPGEALLGAVARVCLTPNSRDAEYSILVSKYVRAMGLGRHLMVRLVRWARTQKVERLYGDVLDQNHPMLGLCESLGFTRQRDQDSPGLFRVMLDLREQYPDKE
ncbi:N-acetyltransferase [Lysobacteraceae bacterium NML03-0222]|nr:N-acetyltransferase [Xanthomonadaceae bacterium NML03-0222]PJK06535.1 N-acetyltransferase [Xanthomonadaceae bacterium NML71-0210]